MKYAIFGAGRVGVNISSYLSHLGHAVSLISHAEAKTSPDTCRAKIDDAEVVAAAVPDGKIDGWRETWAADLAGRTVIHFSGAASVTGVHAFHPLYSFPPHAVDPTQLEGVAFACPNNGPAFANVIPGAPNPHFKISAEERARYHALAVLSGNFAAFLWNETAPELATLSGLEPDRIMAGYLRSVIDRFVEAPAGSLTGPVARKDEKTVAANLDALSDNLKLKELYESFLRAAWPDYPA